MVAEYPRERLWASGMSSSQVIKSIAPPAKPKERPRAMGEIPPNSAPKRAPSPMGRPASAVARRVLPLLLPPPSKHSAMASPSGKL